MILLFNALTPADAILVFARRPTAARFLATPCSLQIIRLAFDVPTRFPTPPRVSLERVYLAPTENPDCAMTVSFSRTRCASRKHLIFSRIFLLSEVFVDDLSPEGPVKLDTSCATAARNQPQSPAARNTMWGACVLAAM